eukprot:2739123-Pyramimonas_sp.AAC.1
MGVDLRSAVFGQQLHHIVQASLAQILLSCGIGPRGGVKRKPFRTCRTCFTLRVILCASIELGFAF